MYGAGGQKRVPDEFFCNFAVGIPSIQEQTAIAAFLDRETAHIDRLIAATDKSIALAQERRSALISAAVTGKIDVREAA
jgi:type I restriction enzyme S subunit